MMELARGVIINGSCNRRANKKNNNNINIKSSRFMVLHHTLMPSTNQTTIKTTTTKTLFKTSPEVKNTIKRTHMMLLPLIFLLTSFIIPCTYAFENNDIDFEDNVILNKNSPPIDLYSESDVDKSTSQELVTTLKDNIKIEVRNEIEMQQNVSSVSSILEDKKEINFFQISDNHDQKDKDKVKHDEENSDEENDNSVQLPEVVEKIVAGGNSAETSSSDLSRSSKSTNLDVQSTIPLTDQNMVDTGNNEENAYSMLTTTENPIEYSTLESANMDGENLSLVFKNEPLSSQDLPLPASFDNTETENDIKQVISEVELDDLAPFPSNHNVIKKQEVVEPVEENLIQSTTELPEETTLFSGAVGDIAREERIGLGIDEEIMNVIEEKSSLSVEDLNESVNNNNNNNNNNNEETVKEIIEKELVEQEDNQSVEKHVIDVNEVNTLQPENSNDENDQQNTKGKVKDSSESEPENSNDENYQQNIEEEVKKSSETQPENSNDENDQQNTEEEVKSSSESESENRSDGNDQQNTEEEVKNNTGEGSGESSEEKNEMTIEITTTESSVESSSTYSSSGLENIAWALPENVDNIGSLKGSRSISRENGFTDAAARSLDGSYSPNNSLNDKLNAESAGSTSSSERSAFVIGFCSGVAVLFVLVSAIVFVVSLRRQQGILDIELQEKRCGKDNLHEEDAETHTKLLEIELPPPTMMTALTLTDTTEECL